MIERVLVYVQKLAMACLVGQMFFFAAIFAPTVFSVLPREQAAQLQNAIFPAYFTAGIIFAALVLLLHFSRNVLTPQRGERLRAHLVTALSLIVLLIFIYSKAVLLPQIAAAQAANLAGSPSADFAFLHKLSVQLNGGAFVLLLVLLALI